VTLRFKYRRDSETTHSPRPAGSTVILAIGASKGHQGDRQWKTEPSGHDYGS